MDGYGDPWPPYPNGGQDEWLLTYGGATTSRIKGSQECFAMKFPLSTHAGKTVVDAELHLCRANTDPIHALVAATINTDWVESSVCWRYRSLQNDWTYPYSDFSTATFGNHGSLVCYAYNSSGTYGSYVDGGRTWIRMKLDPTLVASLILLDQYGISVTDPRGYNGGYNPLVYTREAGSATQPKLYIKFASTTDTTPPGPVGNLTAEAGPENGEVVLSFTAPADATDGKALGYYVKYSTINQYSLATNLPRWRIPRPAAPGTPQKVLLEGLTPGSTYYLFVQPYDATGNLGTVQSVSFTLPAAWTAPTLVDGRFTAPNPAGKTVRTVPGVMRYWATTELTKVNPTTGNRMEDVDDKGKSVYALTTPYEDYKKANPVWDSASNTISLSAARNEVVGCQLVIERLGTSLTNVGIQVSDLTGPGGTFPTNTGTTPSSPYVEFFQMHYVPSGGVRYPDAAIPLPLSAIQSKTFNIPDANRNPGGVNQSVWMDIYVPKYTGVTPNTMPFEPGDYTGTITITAAQLASPVTINLKLRVSPTILPDSPTYIVDCNGYGNPWDFGTNYNQTCLRYFQVTHKHRVCINTLPAGWSGSVPSDRQPAYWSSFNTKYGPMFLTDPTKSAFSRTNTTSPYYGPGENTPITHFYTGFNENWPASMTNLSTGYDPSPALPNCPGLGGEYWNTQVDGNTASQNNAWDNMPDVQIAWPDAYKNTVRNKVAEWFTNCSTRGYHNTAFQIYLNDKWSYTNCPSLWVLEECSAGDDFRALNFFHTLYRQGEAQSGVTNVKWHYRIDISDRWSQSYGQLDNVLNLQVVNGGASSWWWPNIKYRSYELQVPEKWWYYGGGPGITQQGIGFSRLFLQRWSQGFEGGMCYWDHFQTNWTAAEDLSSIYRGSTLPGAANVYNGPIIANRIKMMRQAQQIIELANLWAGAEGMSFEKARKSLQAKFSAGTYDYSYNTLDENGLYKLKADLIAQVEASRYMVGDINGDGSVDVVDLLRFVAAFGTASGDSTWDSFCDFNADDYVDVVDLLTFVENFGVTYDVPQ